MSKGAIVVLLMLCSIGLAAAAPPVPAEPSDATASVTVQAQRQKLMDLSVQMAKLEDRIYSDYNKLNPHHQYDIFCTLDVPTDSHLRNRQCLPAYVEEARADEALDFVQQAGGMGGRPARPASMVVLQNRDDFIKNYRRVINSHPELLELDRKYGELQKAYQAALHGRLKDHMIDWR